MCEENRENNCGPTNKDFAAKMHHMGGAMPHMGGHGHDDMKKIMMKKIMMKKIMEQLSDEDKKKVLVAKMDMKASMAQQKIDLIKMIRDMIKD